MASSFFDHPILNSPYLPPTRHHPLDKEGQPLDGPPVERRRPSELLTPVPKPRKRKRGDAEDASLFDRDKDAKSKQKYDVNLLVNTIRRHVEGWRSLKNPADWGVTPATARLLTHWRSHQFNGPRPFFCQVEAVETMIWLTEVARGDRKFKPIWDQIIDANNDANPELMRLAMKMATGSGKTTVMSMLIAWQTVNAVRSPTSPLFSRGFLIIAPGITIKDRLRVLLPDDTESYYRSREILPLDLLPDMGKAKIIITNYHAFKLRDTIQASKVTKDLIEGRVPGRPEKLRSLQTEGQMLHDVCSELLAMKNVVVINDEAHHCYRERPDKEDEGDLKGEEKDEAKENNVAARLWISGIEALNRKIGVRATYDLSATPFFLRGSGYAEGTLFPWTVSDFSLMDAIECGIVKLPRVPVADNLPEGDMPIYRDLWNHLKEQGYSLPKKGTRQGRCARSTQPASADPDGAPFSL